MNQTFAVPVVVTYVYQCSHTGLVIRRRSHEVSSIKDEPYPPGGTLRIFRNRCGQIIAGPLREELLSFDIASSGVST